MFGKKLRKRPRIFGVNYFLKDLKEEDFLNSRRDKHVWVKWMEKRIHRDVEAIETPTGLIPRYKDLVVLFDKVLSKKYTMEEYNVQFSIRVRENLAKIRRVEEFFKRSVSNMPDEFFEVLKQQKNRLLEAQKRFGDYIIPEKFI